MGSWGDERFRQVGETEMNIGKRDNSKRRKYGEVYRNCKSHVKRGKNGLPSNFERDMYYNNIIISSGVGVVAHVGRPFRVFWF